MKEPNNSAARFRELLTGAGRDGTDKLLEWLTHKTDFFTAPASTRFHGAYAGGLVDHSLNVFDETVRLAAAYPEIKVPPDSIIIASLLHDVCKVNTYATEKRNRKNAAGLWESYDAFVRREQFCYGSHGGKSVFLVSRFIRLTDEEAVAINCHMGAFLAESEQDVSAAYEQFPFAWLLHSADEAATFITERKES